MGLVEMLKTRYKLPGPQRAIKGRADAIVSDLKHYLNGRSLHPPFPPHLQQICFGMGCFWGAERIFWQLDGVYVTAVGYMAGITRNPTYEEVCTGLTSHNEVVLVVYDPLVISLETLLKTFWENHDPTQGMRQGNDRGTQYRSGIYVSGKAQFQVACDMRDAYQDVLTQSGKGKITTEILDMPDFYYAEEYHQQYLEKNPGGYCGIGGTGVSCPLTTGESL